jgi:hypothetical protein
LFFWQVELVEGKTTPVWKRELWAFNTKDSTWLDVRLLVQRLVPECEC